MIIRRSDILSVDLDPVVGSEQGNVRPCLVIQNNVGNRFSPTTIVAPITSSRNQKSYPTNVNILSSGTGLDSDSTIMLNQIKAIDKKRIVKKIGFVNGDIMKKVDEAIKVSLGLS